MIFAGVKMDDPRAKAALKWIQKNYSLNLNPGMGKQGLYYYYHTFAKTLTVMKVDTVEDAKGVKHDWRKELTLKLIKEQQPNGSWTNSADRWYEGDPNLVTAYSLMALSYCDAK
jgi:squalene-hopene/tetraprenyl-beta-curcumene cyclase